MAKVFISYSRKDIDFAKRLTGELQKSELDFWIDWEGIPPTVDWWGEIEKGIEESDAFLFLISPNSAKSKICEQEIDVAVKNGKRLIPLVVRDIKDEETPTQLRHLNWIFFRKDDDFDTSLKKLMSALHTDFEWVQVHRQLQVKALEWERSQRENSFLLRGKELQDAEFQLATNSSKEPYPTDLQREYIFASRKSVDRQKRVITGIAIAGIIVFAILAAFGLFQAQRAGSARNEAEANLYKAQTLQAVAQNNQYQADANAATAQAQATTAAIARAAADNSANLAATAQAIAENAQADTVKALEQVQAVAKYRAQALASLSQQAGNRNSPLADLLAVEAYNTTANASTISRLFELLQTDLMMFPPLEAKHGVYVIKFNPKQSDQLAVSYDNGSDPLKLWQVPNTGSNEVALQENKKAVYGLAFSRDGQTLASGDFDGRIIIWNVQSRPQIEKQLDVHNRIFGLAFSPDGQWLVSGGVDQKLTLWNTTTWQQERQLEGHKNTVNTLAFSPDGQFLASGDNDGKLIIWDTSTFEVKQILVAPNTKPAEIMHLDFSPDGKTIATGDNGGAIYIWKMQDTGFQFEQSLPKQPQRVSILSFSRNGKWLASGSYDGNVLLWDATDYELLAKIPTTDNSRIYSVIFSPDSNSTLLAIGNQRGSVTLWNMEPEFWLEQACASAGRNLTQAEWSKYFPGEPYRSTCSQWSAGQ